MSIRYTDNAWPRNFWKRSLYLILVFLFASTPVAYYKPFLVMLPVTGPIVGLLIIYYWYKIPRRGTNYPQYPITLLFPYIRRASRNIGRKSR